MDIPNIDPTRGVERFHIENKNGCFTVEMAHPFRQGEVHPSYWHSVALTAWPYLIERQTGLKSLWTFDTEPLAQEALAWLKVFIFDYWSALYELAGRSYEREMKYLNEPKLPYA